MRSQVVQGTLLKHIFRRYAAYDVACAGNQFSRLHVYDRTSLVSNVYAASRD
jgi:hypothetical protein